MIETEYKTLRVEATRKLNDDEVRISIEDTDPYGFGDARLVLCFLKEKELGKLIADLQEAERKLKAKKQRLKEIIDTTDFSRLYNEFERKYNPYPVQMARYEAFRYALRDKLISEEVYEAAEVCYGRLWSYVGD